MEESAQKLIAKAYIRTFLDSTIGDDDTYLSLLSDKTEYDAYLPQTVYVTNYENSDFISLCSFDDTVNISSFGDGVTIDVRGADTWTIKPYERGSGGEGEDYILSVSWLEESNPTVDVSLPHIDISDGSLVFRIADMREHTEELTEGLDYTVELTDASGHSVSCHCPEFVYHSLAVQLYKQDVLFGSYEYKHQLQTVNIRPDSFQPDTMGNFDFTAVVGVRISLDGTEKGELIINDLGYYEK